MKLEITINNEVTVVDLEPLTSLQAGIVTIGKKCEEVWNAIPLVSESVDPFQCHLMGAAGEWKIINGQERTECPKGLRSPKLVPCNGCMGRCVNIRPGRPKYPQRLPENPTMVNGEPISEWGQPLNVGDIISFADVDIKVLE